MSPSVEGRTETESEVAGSPGFARRHVFLLVLLVPAVVVRVLATVTYWPGMKFWRDSWLYLDAARDLRPPVTRVLGYSAFVRLLELVGPLGLVTVVQHLLGLAIGVGIYVLLARRGVPAWGAALAAAPVLLDGYQIDIEQFFVSETLFSALLLAVVALALTRDRISPPRAALLGLTVAALVLTRSVAMPIAILLGVHLLARRVGWRPLVAFALTVVLPLGGYLSWFKSEHGAYGFSLMSGRLLYGKTAQFADCSALPANERSLCPKLPPDQRFDADFYSFGPGSPSAALRYTPDGDGALGRFGRAVIVAEPVAYARIVGEDLVHYAEPRRVPRERDQRLLTWQFPTKPNPTFTVSIPGRYGYAYAHLERSPGGPTQLLRHYQVIAMPGTALALCGGLTLAGAIAGRSRRKDDRADDGADDETVPVLRVDLALLSAIALMFVLIPAMTVSLDYRFLLPELVIGPVGAALGLRALADRAREGQPVRSTAKATAPSSTANANSS